VPTRNPNPRHIPALAVRQWLPSWDSIDFEPKERRRKPPEEFYVFSLDARDLRLLSGIQRRDADEVTPRIADTGIQRAHDKKRSSEIGRFVEHGYPWSTLSPSERKSGDYADLRKPGWLPTAIVVNILTDGDRRPDGRVQPADQVVVSTDDRPTVILPRAFGPNWKPSAIPPIEVIDGQHRLWSFDESFKGNFDLPVVAFVGLDISWQAYLFWTINIKPTKINPSLAFDLYPLLRAEDWLERTEGPKVYREARAQELTEVLWSYPESPWHRRINMLGQTRGLGVTQAGFVRSLTNTFIKRPPKRRTVSGGLFTSPLGEADSPLSWNRTQQAAALVFSWQVIEDAVRASTADWAQTLRLRPEELTETFDPAFAGRDTNLNTEQGVRAYLSVVNDLSFARADDLELGEWQALTPDGSLDLDAIDLELASLLEQPWSAFLEALADALASFDWRGADAPGLRDHERSLKRAFRGSGGYVEFRRQLLSHVGRHGDDELKELANELYRLIKDPR
jgi:hypothetical protein